MQSNPAKFYAVLIKNKKNAINEKKHLHCTAKRINTHPRFYVAYV